MMSFNAIPMIPAEATVVGNHIVNKKRRLIKTIVGDDKGQGNKGCNITV